jgi:AcrR family transcriptional regulator
MGGKRMRGEERRKSILAHAKHVFAEHSYADASTGELARASDVTEPMLYKHFGSKRGLFLAVLDEFGNRFLQMFRERVSRKAEQNLVEELGQVFLDYRETIQADPDIQRVLFQGLSEVNDAQVAQGVREYNQDLYMLVHQLLERAQKEEIIRADVHLEVATWGYLSVILAMQYSVILDFQPELTKGTLTELNRFWLRALQP